jgi:hypothetical protein
MSSETRLGTIKPHFYKPVKPGFEPSKADDATLAAHGLPPRPTNGHRRHLAAWESFIGRYVQGKWVEAVIEAVPTAHRRRKVPADLVNSGVFAGVLLYRPNDNPNPVIAHLGRWNVPSLSSPSGGPIPVTGFGCCTHITIDEDGSDFFAVGVDTFLLPTGTVSTFMFYWALIDPNNVFNVSSVPVSSGDEVICWINLTDTNSPDRPNNQTATVHYTNNTTGMSTSISIETASNEHIAGTSAGWSIEPLNGQPLPNYGVVNFTDCVTGGNNWVGEPGMSGSNTNDVVQTDASGTQISVGAVPGEGSVICFYTGP